MLETAPQQSQALVVGIDHYEYGERWRLSGPVADALRRVDWLLERGMQAANIALFLSGRSWTEDADVVKWAAERGWTGRRCATASDIAGFVNKELLKVDPQAQALLLCWGGHGVVDDFDNSNYLYTEDATDGDPYCISVPNLMRALHSKKFSRLREQVLIVDACANAFSQTGEKARPGVTNIGSVAIDNAIRQFSMFAASPGKLARNVPARKTGRFSEALMAALRADGRDGWPDFAAAFERTVADAMNSGLADQRPYMAVDWPGIGLGEVRFGALPCGSSRVASLLALIQRNPASLGLLFRLYERTLPDIHRSIGNATIREWLLDLEDKQPRDPNHPPPLIQFAERVARELDSVEIKAWVDDNTDGNAIGCKAMRDALDAEARSNLRRAMVFIEIGAPVPGKLEWWIHAPDPAVCTTREEADFDLVLMPDAAALRLGEIAAKVERTVGGRFAPVLALILPDNLLGAGIESIKVKFEDGKVQALNRRYPVTLHWQVRTRAPVGPGPMAVNAWRQALAALKPRIAGALGVEVEWIEAGDGEEEEEVDPAAEVAARLLEGEGICVGLGHPTPPVADRPPKEIMGCLLAGVPCFFWLARPQAGEPGEVRKTLRELFSKQDPREAPMLIGKKLMLAKAAHPLSSIRIVWDEPGHVPFASEN